MGGRESAGCGVGVSRAAPHPRLKGILDLLQPLLPQDYNPIRQAEGKKGDDSKPVHAPEKNNKNSENSEAQGKISHQT
jgi:hypothetical protein